MTSRVVRDHPIAGPLQLFGQSDHVPSSLFPVSPWQITIVARVAVADGHHLVARLTPSAVRRIGPTTLCLDPTVSGCGRSALHGSWSLRTPISYPCPPGSKPAQACSDTDGTERDVHQSVHLIPLNLNCRGTSRRLSRQGGNDRAIRCQFGRWGACPLAEGGGRTAQRRVRLPASRGPSENERKGVVR